MGIVWMGMWLRIVVTGGLLRTRAQNGVNQLFFNRFDVALSLWETKLKTKMHGRDELRRCQSRLRGVGVSLIMLRLGIARVIHKRSLSKPWRSVRGRCHELCLE